MEAASFDALLFVGLPGSGKSTFSQPLAELGWTVVSQDELGERVACEQLAWESLAAGGRVLLDRCNHTAWQRAGWLSLFRAVRGPEARVAAVVFGTSAEDCVRRIAGRTGHPTLGGEEAPGVVARFAAEFEEVKQEEGFAAVLRPEDVVAGERVTAAKAAERRTAGVLKKLQCVYLADFAAQQASAKEGREGAVLATPRVRPAAAEALKGAVATVKVHGRCCMWRGGRPFRRLDIDLEKAEGKGKDSAAVDALIARMNKAVGMDLESCWQAGQSRSWSWRECIVRSYGWIGACLEKGWFPTSAPDRHGHWIGYVPVRHFDEKKRVLPVDHDADVRHGFDEERGVAFCLRWGVAFEEGEEGERLALREVPMAEMADGTYELIGAHDAFGGPYKDCLPLADTYKIFPDWPEERAERSFFIKHGAVRWRGASAPPGVEDQEALKAWMASAGVEGVVWHCEKGEMFKCHFGHLGLPAPKLRFSRADHEFLEESCGSIRRALTVPGQEVVLLRHGRSLAQQATQKQRSCDEGLHDAALCREGERQAAAVRVVDLPELVVVSPLRRALQTLQGLRLPPSTPVIAHPCLQEHSGARGGFESVGRTLAEMRKDNSIDLEGVDVSLLGGASEQWWAPGTESPQPRLKAFLSWLRERPERFVLIVGHHNIFKELTGRSLENCSPASFVLKDSGLVTLHEGCALPPLGGAVTLRLCRQSEQKDMRSVSLPRDAGPKEVLQAAKNKWSGKKFKPTRAWLQEAGGELEAGGLATLEHGTVIVCG